MGVGLQLSRHRLELQVVAAHQPRLLEIKFKLMMLVHVVQDYETVTDLPTLKLSKVNSFKTEGSHLAFLTDVGSALW